MDDFLSTIATTGILLPDGTPANGNLETSLDQDWFALSVVAGETYEITMDSATITLFQRTVRLFDDAGSLILNDFDGTFFYTATTTGTVFVSAGADSGVTGEYSVTANLIPDDFADDPSTTGVLLTDGTVTNGSSDFSQDRDWFELNLVAGEIYNFNFDSPTISTFQRNLQILSATETSLATSFDGSLSFIAPTTGVFYINAFADNGVTGSYSLTGEVVTDDFAGDTSTTGVLPLDGSLIAANVEFDGDRDWFALDVVEGNVYTVTLDSMTLSTFQRNLRLFDSAGMSILETSSNGDLTFIATSTGTQYIEAFADNNITTADYTLSVSVIADDFRGDDSTQATLPIDGNVVQGEIQFAQDQDWLILNVEAGTDYTITLTNISGNNLRLQRLDDASQILETTGFNAGVLEFTATTTGLQYIAVLGSNDLAEYEISAVAVPRLDIDGTESDDVLIGDTNNDLLDGLGGDDTIFGDEGNDRIDGGIGEDSLFGDGGNDTLLGQFGDDIVSGGSGNDNLIGGPGDDIITGDDGDDTVFGEGNLTSTASNSVVVPSTQQTLAVSLSAPSGSTAGTATVTGLLSRVNVTNDNFNIAYVIDVSGSTSSAFSGDETVGDLNGDGASNQLIDGLILAFESLNQSLIDSNLGQSNVAIIPFQSNASILFQGAANSDINLDGQTDVQDNLRTLDSSGGTNFEVALQQTVSFFNTAPVGVNRVFFISDGFGSGAFADEVNILLNENGLNAEIRSIGLGQGASLTQLDLVDDGISNMSAERALEPSQLTAGLVGSPVSSSEIESVEIFVNNILVATILPADLVDTPFGLQYSVDLNSLNVSADDTVEARLTASDPDMTMVSATIIIPNIELGEGNDLINGGAGNDRLNGGVGADIIFGETGDDILNGDAGDDELNGDAGNDNLNGGLGNDLLDGGRGEDALNGGDGNDIIFGGLENDILFGGEGDDIIDGGAGRDIIDGGAGNDTYSVASRDEEFSINLNSGVSLIVGLESNTLTSIENVTGGTGIDRVFGNSEANILSGGDGDDTLAGLGGIDVLNGDAGDDSLAGGSGNDTLNGGAGRDRLFGNNEDDTLRGDAGEDLANGGNGNDMIFGGDDDDTLVGGNGDDELNGENGDDSLDGSAGNDTLRGGDGEDSLFGGAGDYWRRR